MTNKRLTSRFGLKGLFCALVALCALLPSCNKKEPSDVSSLLSTVPSSAGVVVGIDLRSVLEKAGCKVDGSDITPGKEVEEWLAGNNTNGPKGEMLRMFLNGESGIDPEGAVLFVDAYNFYATAMLADTGKFISFVEEKSGNKFSEAEGGVKVCGNVAVNGAQMWMAPNASGIDPRAIKNYSSLSEGQNFLSKNVSAPIASMEKDIVAWGETGTLAKYYLSFGDLATFNLIVGALFDNPTSLAMSVDFQEGKAMGELKVLNDKGNTAKFLLPTKKIDVDLVKGLGGQADVVVAGNITKDFSKKVEKMLSSFGGGMFDNYIKPLSQIDGTVAVELGVRQNGELPINGVVQTDGDPNPDVMNFIAQFGTTRKDGNSVRFSKGEMNGNLKVEDEASEMKGAWLGIAYSTGSDSKWNLSSLNCSLVPEDGGLRLDATGNFKDASKSSLLSLIQDFALN
ncbi:MAG: DUF4836 family protein [Muribaculaceae bacterium]|nr:DUF4836 family protein [Muribaculaceae bacterium]